MTRKNEKRPEYKREEAEESTQEEVQFSYEQSGERHDLPPDQSLHVRRP